MQITDVRVKKVAKEGKMKAIVSITIEKGLFIAMPSKKSLDGEYRDIAHPINSDTRDNIQNIILEKYEQSLTETDAGQPKAS